MGKTISSSRTSGGTARGYLAEAKDPKAPGVVVIQKKLQAAGKKFEIHRYPGHHAFMNSDRQEVHDAQPAKQAWDRCVAFFRKHLA